MPDEVIRVLLVDDHDGVRRSLKEHLDAQPDIRVVAETGDGHAGIRLASEVGPAIAIIDVSMREPDGVTVCRRITAGAPGVKVIAFTWHTERAAAQQMMDAGASGYVLKRSAGTGLVAAVRAVARGETYVDAALRPVAPTTEAPDRPAVLPPGILDPREEQVLRLVAAARSNQEIAAALDESLDEVKRLKAAAMDKARLTNRVQVMRYARSAGWLAES